MHVVRNGGRKCAGNLASQIGVAPHRQQELRVLPSGIRSARFVFEIGGADVKLPGPNGASESNQNVPEHKYQAQNAPFKQFQQRRATLAAVGLREEIACITPRYAIGN